MTVVPAPLMLAAAAAHAGSAAQRQCAAHVRKASTVPTQHSYPQAKGLDTHNVDVPVIGGHAGETILPPISQVGHCDNKWAATVVFFAQASLGCGWWHGWCTRRWGCGGTLTLYRPDLNRAATSSCRHRPSCWVGRRSARLSGLGAGAAAGHLWEHAACVCMMTLHLFAACPAPPPPAQSLKLGRCMHDATAASGLNPPRAPPRPQVANACRAHSGSLISCDGYRLAQLCNSGDLGAPAAGGHKRVGAAASLPK